MVFFTRFNGHFFLSLSLEINDFAHSFGVTSFPDFFNNAPLRVIHYVRARADVCVCEHDAYAPIYRHNRVCVYSTRFVLKTICTHQKMCWLELKDTRIGRTTYTPIAHTHTHSNPATRAHKHRHTTSGRFCIAKEKRPWRGGKAAKGWYAGRTSDCGRIVGVGGGRGKNCEKEFSAWTRLGHLLVCVCVVCVYKFETMRLVYIHRVRFTSLASHTTTKARAMRRNRVACAVCFSAI